MAQTALDIVSLDLFKQELRLDLDEDSQDAILTGHIKGGVSFVQRYIETPLIDRTNKLRARRRSARRPLYVPRRAIKRVEAVRFWTPNSSLRQEPDGTIISATLGRLVAQDSSTFWQWPPESGWPEILFGSRIELTLLQGLDIGDDQEALRQAVILVARQLYDGYSDIRPNAAFYALLDDFRHYN